VQRIPTPASPADLAAHMSPPAVTNQCVAGARATWALLHRGDPLWNHPPALIGNAIDLYGVAVAQGFVVSRQPVVGAMVVYGSAYGPFGHIATVVAVQPDRHEVVEESFVDFSVGGGSLCDP
jgi:surface antigen